MNPHVTRYYSRGERFFSVTPLHESPEETWESVHERCSDLPKGWFELSRLSVEDRIEFVKGYWVATLPFVPHVNTFLDTFFDGLEDIGIFLTRQNEGDPVLPEMVYSLKNDGGFFHGSPPAKPEQIAALEGEFDFCQFSDDYLAFLAIHDGFCKANDTGVVPVDAMPLVYDEFQTLLEEKAELKFSGGEGVNLQHLLPFYQSFGLCCFQCFYADWYPEHEMGNLYYSGHDHTLSDYRQKGALDEKLAFPTFLDWLVFYLETPLDVHR